jgi:hypothetical protein
VRPSQHTSPAYEDLALAFRLADEARAISLSRFRGDFAQRTKADGSIVTEVDEAVEDELSRRRGISPHRRSWWKKRDGPCRDINRCSPARLRTPPQR